MSEKIETKPHWEHDLSGWMYRQNCLVYGYVTKNPTKLKKYRAYFDEEYIGEYYTLVDAAKAVEKEREGRL